MVNTMPMVRAVKSNDVYVGMRMCRRMKNNNTFECGSVIEYCVDGPNVINGTMRIDGHMKDEPFTIETTTQLIAK